MTGAARLYTPELLALTVRLSDYLWSDDLPLRGEARSPSCGSTLAMGLACDAQGRIERLGMRAQACAVGQAAAAIFAGAASGSDLARLGVAQADLAGWLSGERASPPDWPGIAALAAARAYPGRHGAILLPWKAACAALSNPPAGR